MTTIGITMFFVSWAVLFFAAISKSMAFPEMDDTSLQDIGIAVGTTGACWGLAVAVIYGYILV